MASKSAPNLRYLHRKCWQTRQGARPVIELTPQNAEVRPCPGITKESGGLPAFNDHRLYLQALQEMLESDHYQIALVPRGGRDLIRGSQAESLSTAATTVLIPFRWKELVAQLSEFVLIPKRSFARFEDVCVDFTMMQVSRSSGESITLTSQEFKTLRCFLENPERVFSRGELLNEAWGYENYPSTRTVDHHVYKLRQKLEKDPARPVHFRTVHRAGYKFVP